jgi:hypothetical protein
VTRSTIALADELERRGLLRARGGPVPKRGDRPWFIGLVLGVSGWLAGLFGLLFVWSLFEPAGPTGFATAGIVMLAAAFGLYFAGRANAFADQLALALSIAGQLSFLWAVGDATDSAAATAAAAALMQAVLLIAMPNGLARTLAAFFACVALTAAVRFAWWEPALDLGGRPAVVLGPALASWVVIWVPLLVLAFALLRREAQWMAGPARRIVRPGLNGLLAALALGTWASDPFASFTFFRPDGDGNWLVLWPMLGAGTALLAARLAFRLRDRPLVGVAIVGALLHVTHFYYLLGTTLLVKSVIMIALGALLLSAAFVARRRAGARRES